MRKLFFSLHFAIFLFTIGFSQTETNVEALKTFAEEKAIEYNKKKAEALEYADNNNIPVRFEADKTQFELQYIDETGKPIYYITHNANAAATISTNKVYPGGGAGLNLNGTGITVREWDAGAVRVSHQEYGGRVVMGDGASTTHYHATHVAGTIMAAGVVPSAKGMAYNANLRAFDWNNDASEMATEGANGCLMSNHSYGFGRGWTWTGSGYTWYGNSSISTIEDYQFGFYNSYSQQYDQVAYNAPNYLICVSAGNDRNEGPNTSPPNDGPYDCIADYAISKNTLTVGAVNDIPGGYTSPSSVVMSSFSSWGPADDGRIKPDIVANGVSLYSTDDDHNSDYRTLSGTSMSSPSATGSVALLQQHHNNLTGSYMRSATLKALVIHTADEAGSNTGPDYEFGWGLMNTESAALKISEDQTVDVISEHTLTNGGIYTRNVTALGTEPLKVTIVWTDYPGTPVSAQLDPITPMIKNELDLRVDGAKTTYYPWKLNRNSPTAAATNSGENNVDNVEVVYIASPSAGTTYTITVDHDGTLTTGSQAFSMIISGISSVMPPVANFTANNLYPANPMTTVIFTDQSSGNPTSWSWLFTPNTVTYVVGSSSSQNPQVRFNNTGAYTVSLTATNAYGFDTETKTDYIHVGQPGLWTGTTSTDWNTITNWENHEVPSSSTNVSITPAAIRWPTKIGNLTIGTDCNSLNMSSGITELTVTGNLTISSGKTFYVDPTGIPNIKVGGNWVATGTFTPGQSTVILNGGTNSTITGPAGTMTIFNDGFEGANGWTLTGEFELGGPGGLGGNYGNPDPTSAYQGAGILGVDLTGLGSYSGDYEINLGDRAYQAISPTINCTGFTNVSMNFQRWLNVERDQYDNAYIDISNNNGSSWVNIWQNSNTTITDNSWSLQTFDISSYADNQAQVKIRFCIGSSDGSWQYSGWNIDEFNITGTGSFNAVFNNLSVEKLNALVSTNSDVDIQNDFNISSGAYFTNSSGNIFNIMGNAWFMADPSGMASFIDNGTTSVTGTTNIEQYITSQRWHLVSPPVSGATINVYYDIYLKEYNEPTDTWTYLIQPTTIPMTQVKGYSAWASNGYTGTTTVTYTGTLNNSDFVLSNLDYTPAAPMTGFNLVGNPFSCALDWNSSWSMSNMSGWMVIYDNGTFRGIHTDGTPYNGKTDGIIPSSQGFWVRALNASASITIPASERVHSGQAFYKETKEIIHPMVRLETEINGYSDETVIIFHPEATAGFDGYYDLAKFENVEEALQLYTMAVDGNYAVNFYEPDYQEKIIPVGFQTAEEGLYIINASAISNFNGDIGIYLEDLKTSTITKLSDNPQYEFIYDPMDEEHRFNLHFTTEHLGIEEITLSGLKIYSFGQTVYVKNPDQLPGAITIYDVMGQVITTRKTVSNLTEIPITQSSGYYFVKVQTGTALKIEKVFIK